MSAEHGGPGPEEGAESPKVYDPGDERAYIPDWPTQEESDAGVELARHERGRASYERMLRWQRIQAGDEPEPEDWRERSDLQLAEGEYRKYERENRDRADPDWDASDPSRSRMVRKRARRYRAILEGRESRPDDSQELAELQRSHEVIISHPDRYGGPLEPEPEPEKRKIWQRRKKTEEAPVEPAQQPELSVDERIAQARQRLDEALAPRRAREAAQANGEPWSPEPPLRSPRPAGETEPLPLYDPEDDPDDEAWVDRSSRPVSPPDSVPPPPPVFRDEDDPDFGQAWPDNEADDPWYTAPPRQGSAYDDDEPEWGPPPPVPPRGHHVESVGGHHVDTAGMSDSTAAYVRLVLEKAAEFAHHHGSATEGAPALHSGVLGSEFEPAYWAVRESLGASTDEKDAVHWAKRSDFERGRDTGLITHHVINRFRSPKSNDRVDYELWAWPTSDPRIAIVEQRGEGGQVWADVVVTPEDAFETSEGGKTKGPSKLLESYMNGLNARELKRKGRGGHQVYHEEGIEHSTGEIDHLLPENEGLSSSVHIERNTRAYADEAARQKDRGVDGIMAKARTLADEREAKEKKRIDDLLASEARVEKQNADDAEAARLLEQAKQTGEKQTRVVESFGASSEGDTRIHARNEDTVLQSISDPEPIIGVADGMGGHAGGYEASHAAAEAIEEELRRPSTQSRTQRMEQAIRAAHERVETTINNDPKLPPGKGAGTTASVIWMAEQSGDERQAVIGNVGDSRVYVLRADNTLELLTIDDSGLGGTDAEMRVLQERLASVETQANIDALSPMDRAAWVTRNRIGNAIGTNTAMSPPRVSEVTIRPGDKVFATTDGIHDNLTNAEIARIAAGANTAEELAQALVEAATARRPDYEIDATGRGQFVSDHVRSKPDDMSAVAYMFVLEQITAPAAEPKPAEPEEKKEKKKEKPAPDTAGDDKKDGAKEKKVKPEPANKWVHAVEQIVSETSDPETREIKLRQLHAEVAAETGSAATKGKKAQAPNVREINEFIEVFGPALRDAMLEVRRLREPQPAEDKAAEGGGENASSPEAESPAAASQPTSAETPDSAQPDGGDRSARAPRKPRRAARPAEDGQARTEEEPVDVEFWSDGEEPPAPRTVQAEAVAEPAPSEPPEENETEPPDLAIEARPALSEEQDRDFAERDEIYADVLGRLAALNSMRERQDGLNILIRNAVEHGFVEQDPSSLMGVRPTTDLRSQGFVEALEEQAEVFGRSVRPRRGESERARQRRLRSEEQ